MNTINDGGHAFPIFGIDGIISDGMSLRDWLAGQALPALIAQVYSAMERGAPVENDGHAAKVAATKAYLFADAMLAAQSPQATVQPEGE